MELLYGTATGPALMVMGNPDGYVPWIIVFVWLNSHTKLG